MIFEGDIANVLSHIAGLVGFPDVLILLDRGLPLERNLPALGS